MSELKIGFVPRLRRWVRYSTGFHGTLLGLDIYWFADRYVWSQWIRRLAGELCVLAVLLLAAAALSGCSWFQLPFSW